MWAEPCRGLEGRQCQGKRGGHTNGARSSPSTAPCANRSGNLTERDREGQATQNVLLAGVSPAASCLLGPCAHLLTSCPGRVPASSCPALLGWPARTLLGPCAHLLAPVQSSACSPAHTLPGRPAHLLTPCSGRMTTCSHPARVACLPPRALPGPRARLLASCRGGLLTSSRPAGAVRPPPRTLPGPCARLLAPCSGRLLTCSHPARVACPGCAPARAARPPAHLLAPCPGGLLASSRPTHLLAPVQSLACTPHFCQTARKCHAKSGTDVPSRNLSRGPAPFPP